MSAVPMYAVSASDVIGAVQLPVSTSCTSDRAMANSPIRLSTPARRAANSAGFIPSGAARRLASARRSRMWPQRETIGRVVPSSTARTSPAGCFASEALGNPPSSRASTPTRSIERRAPGGMSNLGLSPSNSSSSSGLILSSCSSVGSFPSSSFEIEGTGGKSLGGSGWTTGVPVPGVIVGWPGCAGRGPLVGVGVGVGAGSSNPGGSSDSGRSCALASPLANIPPSAPAIPSAAALASHIVRRIIRSRFPALRQSA